MRNSGALNLFVHASILTFFIVGCDKESSNGPCETVICLNGGECLHGTCICEDGFTGESCETALSPEDILITEIKIPHYPIFSGDAGWDSTLAVPGCWPDLAVGLQLPWGEYVQSSVYPNASGEEVVFSELNFPYLDNHLHLGDSILIDLWEIDGIDSSEVASPPQLLAAIRLSTVDFIMADSLNLWPESIEFTADSLDVEMVIRLNYNF